MCNAHSHNQHLKKKNLEKVQGCFNTENQVYITAFLLITPLAWTAVISAFEVKFRQQLRKKKKTKKQIVPVCTNNAASNNTR